MTMKKWAFTASRWLFGAAFAALMVLLLFFTYVKYYCKKTFLFSNGGILLTLLLLLIGGVLLYRLLESRRPTLARRRFPNTDKLVLGVTAVLFLWQCYVAYNIFFLTGWDAQIILKAAQDIAYDRYANWSHYFSKYPNNLFITYFYAILLRINESYGFFRSEIDVMTIIVVNCFINALSCLLVYKTACVFTEKKTALLAYAAAVLCFGLSPWTVIPYSDALALFIPLLSVFLYVVPIERRRFKTLCRLAAVAVSILGYFIKPQCAIVAIAIMLIEAVRLFSGFSFKKLLRPVAMGLAIVCVFTCVNGLINVANDKADMELNEDRRIGITHFLMMGQNKTSCGVYWGQDVDFSLSFDNPQERSAANLKRTADRLRGMGFVGWMEHLGRKMLVTFNDGTFAWGVEGNFYRVVLDEPNDKMAPFLRSIYYNTNSRSRIPASLRHAVWIAILAFAAMSVFVKGNYPHKYRLPVLWITMLGFILYEALFEVRARYVFIFVPLLCVLAAVGFDNAVRLLRGGTNYLISKLPKRECKK